MSIIFLIIAVFVCIGLIFFLISTAAVIFKKIIQLIKKAIDSVLALIIVLIGFGLLIIICVIFPPMIILLVIFVIYMAYKNC